MTNYPVTKEELEQIRYGCDATKMMEEVLARPDPLALLEAWRKKPLFILIAKRWDMEQGIIRKLRNNPSAVREQGIRDGWWK
jgi:hypothetical protein